MGMTMLAVLSFLVCLNGDLAQCKPVEYVMEVSTPYGCMIAAQPVMTEYLNLNPKWQVPKDSPIRCTPMHKMPGRSI